MNAKSKTVLIAEDSPLQAEMLRRGLEQAGYRVIAAHDGEEALALMGISRPDLVLSDIRMPKMDGYELCRAIRLDETLATTPVILLTELSDPLDVIHGLDAGADGYVTKPYDYPILVARIDSLTAHPVQRAPKEPRREKVSILGRTHEVTGHCPRVLNLLISTYENAVLQNRQLTAAQQALEYLNTTLEERVLQKTESLRKRVRELRLLQGASRLMRDRKLERATIAELVALMPAAWRYTEHCQARITFGDVAVNTSGWQAAARWQQTVSFTTTGGTGTIEVAYVGGPAVDGASPFLPEESEVLESLAEMLVTYAERQLAEERRLALESQLRQSQKMEALGTLAGGIAHDFNNILGAIGMNAELALERQLGPEVQQSLEEIFAAHSRASDLVKRILTFSRRQESERKPVALTPVVEEVVSLLRATLRRNVTVEVKTSPDVPIICADASQLHQVVLNLATNAAHAIGERAGKLSIVLDRVQVDAQRPAPGELPPGSYLRLTVADSGTGMPPEIAERIFEPFFTTKGQGGTGLGLAVVHGIVHEHEGIITVDSAVGRGTTFRLFFPARCGEQSVAPSKPHASRGAGEHIMYVDDEEALLLVGKRALESLGYRCTSFTDPHAALQAFRASPEAFDAVVTDMVMPGMTGLELTRALVGIRADVPVAITSGYGDQCGAGAELVKARLHKPASVLELSSAVRDLVARE